MPSEKIGRFAWLGFIVLAVPSALFCVGTLAMVIRLMFIEDVGPIETPPRTTLEIITPWVFLAAHPTVLLLSIFTAHRFNGTYRAMLPFLLNLLPVVGLFYFVRMPGDCESIANEPTWPAWYLACVAFPLVVGLVASFTSTLREHPSGELNL
ncbi:MAG TPA: hypothetical protein VIM57_00875 [Luteolibacter sp.]